jgi:hypothetical protein
MNDPVLFASQLTESASLKKFQIIYTFEAQKNRKEEIFSGDVCKILLEDEIKCIKLFNNTDYGYYFIAFYVIAILIFSAILLIKIRNYKFIKGIPGSTSLKILEFICPRPVYEKIFFTMYLGYAGRIFSRSGRKAQVEGALGFVAWPPHLGNRHHNPNWFWLNCQDIQSTP